MERHRYNVERHLSYAGNCDYNARAGVSVDAEYGIDRV